MRYLRLYLNFLRFSFSRAMEFRMDFYFRVVMDIIYYAVNISFFKIIYLHTPILAEWSEPQMMVFVSGYLLLDAINMTVFSNNLWMMPAYINKGELDYYLVRPVSSLFFLSVRDFAANSFLNLVIASGIVAWTIAGLPESPGVGKIALFPLLIVNGTLLHYTMAMFTIIPVFWSHGGRGLHQIFWNFARVAERPDRLFNGWVRRVFITVIPFSLMASFPARLLLDEFDWAIFVHLIAVTGVMFFLMTRLWKRGLRSYSSASS